MPSTWCPACSTKAPQLSESEWCALATLLPAKGNKNLSQCIESGAWSLLAYGLSDQIWKIQKKNAGALGNFGAVLPSRSHLDRLTPELASVALDSDRDCLEKLPRHHGGDRQVRREAAEPATNTRSGRSQSVANRCSDPCRQRPPRRSSYSYTRRSFSVGRTSPRSAVR